MNQLDNDLHYRRISRGRIFESEDLVFFNTAYKLWKESFTATFREVINSSYTVYSDEFLLQNEFGALSLKDALIGVIAISEVNTSILADLDRSYFKNYPLNILNKIKDHYQQIFVISNQAINPNYRKSVTRVNYSEHLVGLSVYQFIHSSSDILLTVTRNDKKTDRTVSMFGGKSIQKHMVHNIDGDVFVITKEDGIRAMAQLDKEMRDRIKRLFDESNDKVSQRFFKSMPTDRANTASLPNDHYL